MSVYTESQGQIEPYAEILTTSADVTIATADDAKQYRIESLTAAATTTSNFSLWIDKGATNVFIVSALPIVAGAAPYQLKDHPVTLKKGWSFKCKDATGGNIHVTASLVMITKSRQGQPMPTTQA